MYANGEGVPEDASEAVKWYRKAAEQGVAEAQFNLGVMYANGEGVMRSGGAAADWFYRAGVSFLQDGDREAALTCVERIKSLEEYLGLTLPNAFLADKLLEKIYGAGPENTTPESKDSPSASTVSGTAWPVAGGFLVTNHHVVAGHTRIILLRTDGTRIMAAIAADDVVNDLVLLRPENADLLPAAIPLSSRPVKVGEQVFTIGYPHPGVMGSEPKLTSGIINARTGAQNDPRTYQISVPLQAGNSGGPLINTRGEVVGVVTSKINAVKMFKWTGDLPQNVNYAIKSAYVQISLSSVDPIKSIPQLPAAKSDLTGLAKRIKDSVLLVIAE